jgi:hypothetical protein
LINRHQRERVTIEPLPATGLQQRSQVMIPRPQFVPRARLGPVIGAVDAATLLEVTRRLAVLLGVG